MAEGKARARKSAIRSVFTIILRVEEDQKGPPEIRYSDLRVSFSIHPARSAENGVMPRVKIVLPDPATSNPAVPIPRCSRRRPRKMKSGLARGQTTLFLRRTARCATAIHVIEVERRARHAGPSDLFGASLDLGPPYLRRRQVLVID